MQPLQTISLDIKSKFNNTKCGIKVFIARVKKQATFLTLLQCIPRLQKAENVTFHLHEIFFDTIVMSENTKYGYFSRRSACRKFVYCLPVLRCFCNQSGPLGSRVPGLGLEISQIEHRSSVIQSCFPQNLGPYLLTDRYVQT